MNVGDKIDFGNNTLTVTTNLTDYYSCTSEATNLTDWDVRVLGGVVIPGPELPTEMWSTVIVDGPRGTRFGYILTNEGWVGLMTGAYCSEDSVRLTLTRYPNDYKIGSVL